MDQDFISGIRFAKIFQTLVKNKIQLDKNFLYPGIMLVTLYLALDELAGQYDVSSIFKDCVNHHPEEKIISTYPREDIFR